jgi:hypothetical protein
MKWPFLNAPQSVARMERRFFGAQSGATLAIARDAFNRFRFDLGKG